jgi:drug/metabolite transporter (DMT)-like permease
MDHRSVPTAKAVMVLLWSSGFIVAVLATRHAAPLAVTFWRLAAAALLMTALAAAFRASWPRDPRLIARVAVIGILLQAVQFTGIYLALDHGVAAGVTALLAGSSPLLVAALATALLDERLQRRQWIGSAIGVTGVVLAVADELHGGGSAAGFLFALVGLGGLVGATLIQRVHGAEVDLRAANAIQLIAASVVMAPTAALTQGFAIPAAALPWLVWLTCGLSIGAALLYFWLLRHEKSGEATSFLYLVPATTAIAGVVILDQPVGIGVVIGLFLALAGVRMMSSRSAQRPARKRSRGLARVAFD